MDKQGNRIVTLYSDRRTIPATLWNLDQEGYLGYGEAAEDNHLFQLAYDSFIGQKEKLQKLLDFFKDYRLKLVQVEFIMPGNIPWLILFYLVTEDEKRVMAKIILSKEEGKEMELIECDEELPEDLKQSGC